MPNKPSSGARLGKKAPMAIVRNTDKLALTIVSGKTPSSADDSNNDFSKQVATFSRAKIAGGNSPVTLQEYRTQLTRFFNSVGKSHIQDITPADLNRFAEEWHSSGNYRQIITAVRSLFKWAYRNDIIDRNIAERLILKKAPERSIESYVWLTTPQQKRFQAAAHNDTERLTAAFFLKTGCRNGRSWPRREACGVKWEDIDFDRNLIKIHGKGPGSGGRVRFSHFDNDLKEQFLKHQKSGGRMPIHRKPKKNTDIVRELATRARLPRLAQTKHPVHALKHTFCTNWVLIRRLKKKGEDLRGLAAQVGTDISTLETYVHIADEYLKSSYDETMQLLKEESP